MTKNEYTLKLAEIILTDWRNQLLANESTKGKMNLPGDTVDISWRAMQKAEEITNNFFRE